MTPHGLYWQLGNTPFARQAAYAEWVGQGVSPQEQQTLGRSTHAGWALGEDEFIAALQEKTQRRVSKGRAGRPAQALIESS